MSAAGDLVRLATPMLGAAMLVLLRARRRLIREFRHHEAVSPTSAIPFSSSFPPKTWWLRRLLHAGVLKATEDHRYWLDERAWHRYRAERQRRALAIFAALLIFLTMLFVRDRLHT